MNDDDIRVFTPPAGAVQPAPAAAPRRRRIWPWVLLGLFVLLSALVVLAIVGAVATIDEWGGGNVSISIDDETLVLPPLNGGALVALLFGVAVALVVALVVVPLALLAAFGAAALAVAGVLVAVLAVAAVAASPLLLGVALVWWRLRSGRKAPTASPPAA